MIPTCDMMLSGGRSHKQFTSQVRSIMLNIDFVSRNHKLILDNVKLDQMKNLDFLVIENSRKISNQITQFHATVQKKIAQLNENGKAINKNFVQTHLGMKIH